MVASFAHHGPAPHHGIATPDETPGRADACPSPAPSSCEAMPQRDYGHHGDEVVYATDLDEYGAETLEYMKEMEQRSIPLHNYMEYQRELSWKMRKTLIEWIIEVHAEYDLRPETLFLAVNIMDRYLSKRIVPRLEFQLLGVTSLWVAAKYEEIHGKVPSLAKLAYVCCNAYREQDFVQMELRLLQELEFNLGHPTPETFLKHHCAMLKSQAESVGCDPTEHLGLARYLMEIALVHRRFLAARPSTIALASFLLADRLAGRGVWSCNDPLLLHTVQQLNECIATAPKTIYQKYSNVRYARASLVARACIQERVQSVPAPIKTTFTTVSNPYPSPPSRFERTSSMETLADCWSSPSTGKVVMQPVQFVQAVPAVVYSVGYLPQAGIAQPTMWT